MRRSDERKAKLWTGILVIVCGALLLWGYYWLTGESLFQGGYVVYARVPPSEGLENGSEVRISGVKVGAVRHLALRPGGRVLATIHLEPGIPIPADSRLVLESNGVFGPQVINVDLGSSQRALSPGDTLEATSHPSIVQVGKKAAAQADTILRHVQGLLGDTMISHIDSSAADLQATLSRLRGLVERHANEIGRASRHLSHAAGVVDTSLAGSDLEGTLRDLRATSQQLRSAADSLRTASGALASIAAKVDSGQGTLGRLVNDPTLYEDLTATAESFEALSKDIRKNPGRYVHVSVF